jgi:uncharacterized protein YigE (DUF2233 family)
MKLHKLLFFICLFIAIIIVALFYLKTNKINEDLFVTYIVDSKKQPIQMFWKNDSNEVLGSLQKLKTYTENKNQQLLFAINGGMYKKDHSPQGLYIEKGKLLSILDTTSEEGNFYLKPNGIFYITNLNETHVCKSDEFILTENILHATQYGPMLIIDGLIHPVFKKDSKSLNIRNGVGVLPNGNTLFVMSKKEINFYDFATYFKMKGCKNALYLDGFVSRMYLPEKKWEQLDGDFGVMIGITENNY